MAYYTTMIVVGVVYLLYFLLGYAFGRQIVKTIRERTWKQFLLMGGLILIALCLMRMTLASPAKRTGFEKDILKEMDGIINALHKDAPGDPTWEELRFYKELGLSPSCTRFRELRKIFEENEKDSLFSCDVLRVTFFECFCQLTENEIWGDQIMKRYMIKRKGNYETALEEFRKLKLRLVSKATEMGIAKNGTGNLTLVCNEKEQKPICALEEQLIDLMEGMQVGINAGSQNDTEDEDLNGNRTVEMGEASLKVYLAYLHNSDLMVSVETPIAALELLEAGSKNKIPKLESDMKDLLLSKEDGWLDVDAALKLFLFARTLPGNQGDKLKEKAVAVMNKNHWKLQMAIPYDDIMENNMEAGLELCDYTYKARFQFKPLQEMRANNTNCSMEYKSLWFSYLFE